MFKSGIVTMYTSPVYIKAIVNFVSLGHSLAHLVARWISRWISRGQVLETTRGKARTKIAINNTLASGYERA